MDELIEAWFARHFHGLGPRLDTEHYSLVHAAKEDLKRILREPAIDPAAAGSTEDHDDGHDDEHDDEHASTPSITASESEE